LLFGGGERHLGPQKGAKKMKWHFASFLSLFLLRGEERVD